MATYQVKTRFTFEGTFVLVADDREMAKEYVMKHCGLVIGGDIHSSLDEDDVSWDFAVHPEKKVLAMKRISKRALHLKDYHKTK